MFKKIIRILPVLVLSMFVVKPAFAEDKLNVVVSILPQAYFVEQIGKDMVDISVMIPPGGNPHTYEPTPSQLRNLSRADVYVKVGTDVEFELVWLDKLQDLNKRMLMCDSSKGIKLISMAEHHHDDHDAESDEGHHDFEWAGAFELPVGEYVWTFSKVDGEYADPMMKMVFLASDLNGEMAIEDREETAEELMESQNIVERVHGDAISPSEVNAYELIFDPNRNVTKFRINIKKEGVYTFFTEHMPFEFEADEHFFKNADGHDIEPIAQEPDTGHHHHHHGGEDPHVWLSPSNAIVMVSNIRDALIERDPGNETFYKNNAASLILELSDLKEDISRKLAGLKNRNFLIYHPSLGYFAAEFDLNQIAVEQGGKDPTPKQLVHLIDEAKENHAKAILVSPQFSQKSARVIADEINGRVESFDPLSRDYINNLRKLAAILAGKK